MKRVLILGSGMVAGPIIRYLLQNNFFVTVAGIDVVRSAELVNNHPNSNVVKWDASDFAMLHTLVQDHDLAVSLLPYKFHVDVARICIEHKKHMVTTSYVKPEMAELDAKAKEAGVVVLNELGVDPGIDHMSAMRIIDHIHDKGGKVAGFYSITGALPAPDCINNPLGYKFSWSPKGVVLASKNDADYLVNGKKIHVNQEELFKDRFELDIPNIAKMDVYPNRDSISYIDIYNVPEVETMFRGTFRFKGWCESLDLIKELDLISDKEYDFSDMTYVEFVRKVSGISAENIENGIAEKFGIGKDNVAIKSLKFLGLFDNMHMNRQKASPFDITSDLMIEKMWMEPGDKDLVVMQHLFLAKYDDGTSEVIKSKLINFGEPNGDTAIARTVALPAAVGVHKILDGEINLTGIYRPVLKEIYNPIMDALENLDIKMEEEYGLPITEFIKR